MNDAFAFGPFRLHPSTRVLLKDGSAVPLGSRAFDILVAMVERAGGVLTRRELMAIAWPQMVVDDSNVRVQIAKLRRTLGCGTDGARYIANIAGRGYCFVAPIERSSPGDRFPAPATEPVAPLEHPSMEREARAQRTMGTVPLPLDGAVGRDESVAELVQLVPQRRVATIVAAAGAGKTTLAILVANELDAFGDSLFFVDLSSVHPDGNIAETLAAAVGYVSAGGDLLPGLIEVLSARRTLIVLDNCEHVIAAVADLCQTVVAATPNVSFLNTSREAIRMREEFVYLLPPLAFPPASGRMTATRALAWPAVKLFVRCSRDGGAREPLDDEDASTVAALCRRLDGNPLAIELVASRVGNYGIQGVANLFESQFALQWQGRRDAIPRHRTVEALIDWSHGLLPERDRKVFHRLAVFSGAFSLDAAAAVVSDAEINSSDVRDAIGDLVDKSLVAVGLEDRKTHIRLFDTTRAYAAERLAGAPDRYDLAHRHAAYYTQQLRERTAGHITGARPIPRLCFGEVANIRSALEWTFTAEPDPALAAELCRFAAPHFLELGLIRECKQMCERAIAELPDRCLSTKLEIDLLDSMAVTYYAGGDYEGSMKPAVERGLALSRQLADDQAMFRFLVGLHLVAMANGEFGSSLDICARYASSAADRGGPTERIIAGWMEGSSKHYAGDPVAADMSYEKSSRRMARHAVRALHYFEAKEQIIGRIGSARVRWALGLPDQALRIAIDTIDESRSHPDSFYMCVTLCFSILLGHGLYDAAEELIEELENVAVDYKVAVRGQVIDVLKGQLRLSQGQFRAAIPHLQNCLAFLPPPKMSVVRTDALQSLAEARCRCGDSAGAIAAINEAIELAGTTRGTFNLSDLLRTKAEVMMSLPDAQQSEVDDVLSQAIDCARSQRALGWELRVAIASARAHILQGKVEEGRAILAPVYSRFTEGFDSSDLKSAAQLLQSTGTVAATTTVSTLP